jgi:[histone H3]-lysine36 N-trimethyltransferase
MQLTEDQAALRQVMRLRGFSQMTNILKDYDDDEDITTVVSPGHLFLWTCRPDETTNLQALECMYTWPLLKRNKVEASGISLPVQTWANSSNEKFSGLAKKVCPACDCLVIVC